MLNEIFGLSNSFSLKFPAILYEEDIWVLPSEDIETSVICPFLICLCLLTIR